MRRRCRPLPAFLSLWRGICRVESRHPSRRRPRRLIASRFRPLPAGPLAAADAPRPDEPPDRGAAEAELPELLDDDLAELEAREDDELEAGLEEAAEEQTGDDDQIDDPIRIYLMQMGEIPMLSREEEIAAARQIERSRRRFRHNMLATDYMLQAAVGLLENIRDGQLAAGPHHRGLGDQPAREAAAAEAPGAEPARRSTT